MSNWDLMMPGMGLTSIGLAGVVISYAGIAHTFIDGMHALTGLTMFVGLIFLSAGILEGGVSTSNRAKATVLVVISISLSFGVAALIYNTVSTVPTFAAILMILATPAIVIAYVATKMPQYTRPIGVIFALAAVAGVGSFVAFGLVGPDTYLIAEPEEESAPEVAPEETESVAPGEAEVALDEAAPEDAESVASDVFTVEILAGSAVPDAPDYSPDVATVSRGTIVEWINVDSVGHTVTSTEDNGETFYSQLMNEGDTFQVDTGDLEPGTYEYLCSLHLFMQSTLIVEDAGPEPAVISE